jgi:hypothetical protein
MHEMTEPLFSIRPMKIRALDTVKKQLGVSVTLDVENEEQLGLTSARLEAHHKIQAGCKYLFDEGFVDKPIVIRKPNEAKTEHNWDVAVFAEMNTNHQ